MAAVFEHWMQTYFVQLEEPSSCGTRIWLSRNKNDQAIHNMPANQTAVNVASEHIYLFIYINYLIY